MPPKTIEHQIQARVTAFAAELSALIRQSVMESLNQALGAAPAPRQAAPAATAAPAAGRGKGRRGKRGAKGAGKASGPLAAAIADFVAQNAGSRVEQIAVGLNRPSKSLKPVVAAMVQAGLLTKAGQKRGTNYSIGKGAPSADGAAESPAPARRGGRKKAAGKKRGRRASK